MPPSSSPSKASPSRFSPSFDGDGILVDVNSDSRIKVLGKLVEPLSDTAVYRAGFATIEPLSDTRIKLLDQEFTKLSDTLIMKIGEVSRISDTNIFRSELEVTKLSDSAIFRTGYDARNISSNSRIKNTLLNETLSDTRIKNIFSVEPLSDSTIFNPGYGLVDTISDTRIIEEGTTILPPVESDSRILKSVLIEPLSDTFIKLNPDIQVTSDTAIFRTGYDLIEPLSNTAIFRTGFNDITKLSDSAVERLAFEISELSDTRIKREGGYMYPFQKGKALSDTRIKRTFQTDLLGYTRIKDLDLEITKLSDTLVEIYPTINIPSDTVIELPDTTILIPSYTRIRTTQEITKLSDSRIKEFGNSITKLSDTSIIRNIDISIISDTAIFRSGFDTKDKLSDTLVINIIDITKSSDTTIFRTGFNDILIHAHTEIQIPDNEITKLSDSSIRITVDKPILSDTSIRRDRSNLRVIFQKGRQL
jgi:hypothetical protein